MIVIEQKTGILMYIYNILYIIHLYVYIYMYMYSYDSAKLHNIHVYHYSMPYSMLQGGVTAMPATCELHLTDPANLSQTRTTAEEILSFVVGL